MNVAQMRELCNSLPDNAEIWMSIDPEGNGFSPVDMEIMPAQVKVGRITTPAIVLWPGYADRQVLLDSNGEVIE